MACGVNIRVSFASRAVNHVVGLSAENETSVIIGNIHVEKRSLIKARIAKEVERK